MSLEGLLKEMDRTRKDEQEKMISLMKEQFEAMIGAKDQEIASLRDEIMTLRNWLDHSALPAANPISRRSESMGLIKMNFGKDKPCPEMYSPGEREMLETVRKREESWPGISGAGFSASSEEPVFSQKQESPARESLRPELPEMPHAPFPEREPVGDAASEPLIPEREPVEKAAREPVVEAVSEPVSEPVVEAERKTVREAASEPFEEVVSEPVSEPVVEATSKQHDDFDAGLKLPRPVIPDFEQVVVKKEKKPARPRKRKAASSVKKPENKPSKRK